MSSATPGDFVSVGSVRFLPFQIATETRVPHYYSLRWPCVANGAVSKTTPFWLMNFVYFQTYQSSYSDTARGIREQYRSQGF